MDEPETERQSPQTEAVGRLLAEFLDRRARGEHPTTDDYLGRLADAEARREFRELLDSALVIERTIPCPIEVGSWLGRYRIDEMIGRGGMGVVFRAFDPELERAVAVKILAPDLRLSEEFRDRFARESKVLAQLNHPGIVAIHESGRLGETRFLVMDLVDGVPLAKVIAGLQRKRPRRLSGRDIGEVLARPTPAGRDSLVDPDSYFRTVARIMRDIARAIEAAHGRGVLHHDLNPKNVMLAGGAQPMVLDFGLARSDQPNEPAAQGGLYGTLPYLAPEQLKESRVGNDPRTDIYQLGLVLYEMLTLRRAFEPGNYQTLEPRIRQAAYAWPREVEKEIPRDLEAICLKAIHPDPAQRYAFARDLREDLERFLEGVPTHARPPNVWRRLGLVVRRHRTLTAAALSLSAAALCAVLVWPWSPEPGIWFSMNPATAKPQAIASGDSVYDGDVLGLKVNAREPAIYYAVSWTGADLSSSFVRPLDISFLEDVAPGRESTQRWLATPAEGRELIGLVRVNTGDIPAGELWRERAWVFRSSTRCAWFERWLDELVELAPRHKHGVPFTIAKQSLDRLSRSGRGDPLTKLNEEEKRALQEMTKQFAITETSEWTLKDPKLISATFVLQPGNRH